MRLDFFGEVALEVGSLQQMRQTAKEYWHRGEASSPIESRWEHGPVAVRLSTPIARRWERRGCSRGTVDSFPRLCHPSPRVNVRAGHPPAAIGFAVKSGWAATVLLVGSPASPSLAHSRRIDLSDPAIPDSRQPYHAGFGTARSTGADLTRLVR